MTERTSVVSVDGMPGTQSESQAATSTHLNVIGSLAAGIAHEIKTPTQYVGDNVQFLEETFREIMKMLQRYREAAQAHCPELATAFRDIDNDVDAEYLTVEVPRAISQSLEGLQRITSIVLAIKDLSHPDHGEPVQTDINRLLRTAATVSVSEWRSAAELDLQLADTLPTCDCYPGPLSQVAINLIVNAAHAIAEHSAAGGPPRGLITVSSASSEGGVEFRVRDSGRGIPEAVRPRIFQRHFTTKSKGQGTGQGLHLARQIVEERHGGRIAFETESGIGTVFCVWIPLSCPSSSG